jgi:hypothetical protein
MSETTHLPSSMICLSLARRSSSSALLSILPRGVTLSEVFSTALCQESAQRYTPCSAVHAVFSGTRPVQRCTPCSAVHDVLSGALSQKCLTEQSARKVYNDALCKQSVLRSISKVFCGAFK